MTVLRLDPVSSARRGLSCPDHIIAAFEPGLSPGQRRLLFAAAVTRLALPLAGPKLQPVMAPGTIVPPS